MPEQGDLVRMADTSGGVSSWQDSQHHAKLTVIRNIKKLSQQTETLLSGSRSGSKELTGSSFLKQLTRTEAVLEDTTIIITDEWSARGGKIEGVDLRKMLGQK